MSNIHKIDANVVQTFKSQTLIISPSSAVRELVQNAVDSGATKIEVMVDLYNFRMSVRDNGCGISPDNLNKLGISHSTSKIGNIKDLQDLSTYGYRGEAVSCISNVSKVTIASKTRDFHSTWVRHIPFAAQTLNVIDKDIAEYPFFSLECFKMNESGTTVVIEELLRNLPVRKKYFEKYPLYKTHMALKHDLFQVLVLHPHIDIILDVLEESGKKRNLLHSNNIEASFTIHEKMSTAFSNIYGSMMPPESMKRVTLTFKEYQIDGIISNTPVRSKDFQFVFVNGRRHKNSIFLKLLDSMFQAASFGYEYLDGNIMKKGGRPYNVHPLMIFHVRCPLDIHDLIQDPDKNIWALSQSHIIHPLIVKIVESFLKYQVYAKNTNIKCPSVDRSTTPAKQPYSLTEGMPDSKIRTPKLIEHRISNKWRNYSCISKPVTKQTLIRPQFAKLQKNLANEIGGINNLEDSGLNIKRLNCRSFNCDCFSTNNFFNASIQRSQLRNAEVVNQVGKKFILLRISPTDHNTYPMLIIVDQHASDERIRLEFFLKEFLIDIITGTIAIQTFQDFTISLDATEGDLFEHFEPQLNTWGISYIFEGNKLCITSLPDILHRKFNGNKMLLQQALVQIVNDIKFSKRLPFFLPEASKHLKDFSDTFPWWNYINSIPTVFREIFNSKACRSAIMFGDELSKGECTLLVKGLSSCKFPFQCAHGRPSVIPVAELKPTEENVKFSTPMMEPSCLDYIIDT